MLLLFTFTAGPLLGVYGPTLLDFWRDLAPRKPLSARVFKRTTNTWPLPVSSLFDIEHDWKARAIQEGMKADELEMRGRFQRDFSETIEPPSLR